MNLNLIQLESISSAERQEACPGSSVIVDQVNETSIYAERGTSIHDFAANMLERGLSVEEALKAVPDEEWKDTCHKLDLAKIRSGVATGLRMEVAYAIDFEAEVSRELGQYLGRAYPPTLPTEARGTNDLEGFRADGIPIVKDLKSGNPVTPARDNIQLAFAACSRMLLTGAPAVEGQIAYVREDGSVDLDTHEYTAEELLEVPGRLRRIRLKVINAHERFAATGKVEVNPGGHCKYCPVMLHCPAKTAIVRTVLPELANITDRFKAMTNEQLGAAYLKYEEMAPLFEKIKTTLNAIGRSRGIDLADGRRLRGVEVHKSGVTKETLIKLLLERGMTREEIDKHKTNRIEVHAKVLGSRKKPETEAA